MNRAVGSRCQRSPRSMRLSRVYAIVILFVFAWRFSCARKIPITVCRSVPDSDLYRVVVTLPAIFLRAKER